MAAAAGIATFLLVGVAVTDLLAQNVGFSLFVGGPVGLIAGAIAATVVYLGLDADRPTVERRPALAFGAFGTALVVAFVVGVGGGLTNTESLQLATIVGAIAAVASAFWYRSRPPRAVTS